MAVGVPRWMLLLVLLEKSDLVMMIMVMKAAQTRQHGSNFSKLVAR